MRSMMGNGTWEQGRLGKKSGKKWISQDLISCFGDMNLLRVLNRRETQVDLLVCLFFKRLLWPHCEEWITWSKGEAGGGQSLDGRLLKSPRQDMEALSLLKAVAIVIER